MTEASTDRRHRPKLPERRRAACASAVGLGIAILGERPATGGAAGPARAPRRDALACGDYTQTLNEEA